MQQDFRSLLVSEDGAWKEDAIRDLDERSVLEWIKARVVGPQKDGFGQPGDRWNPEHPADKFFHLASKLQDWRQYRIDYPEFSEVLYNASATFLEQCDREKVGYRDMAAFCWQLAASATYVKDPEAARNLVNRYRNLVLSEKFSWWPFDDIGWTKGVTAKSSDTDIELNVHNMLQRALVRLQAQTGKRGDDAELVEHFDNYDARTKTFVEGFTGKLAFCGDVPDRDWINAHEPFWNFYRMYAKEAGSWSSRALNRIVRQAYSFPYIVRDPDYHEETIKRLAYEIRICKFNSLRTGWNREDVWEEIREGIEENLETYNEYDRRGQEPLSQREFWPMPEDIEDVPALDRS